MKSKIFLFIFAVLFSSFIIMGEESNTQSEMKKIEMKQPSKSIYHRPKAPSRQYVECYYGDGIIYISFAIPEGTATVSVKDLDTDNLQQDFLDTSSPAEIYIGEVSCGEITIETSDGKTYTGEITN